MSSVAEWTNGAARNAVKIAVVVWRRVIAIVMFEAKYDNTIFVVVCFLFCFYVVGVGLLSLKIFVLFLLVLVGLFATWNTSKARAGLPYPLPTRGTIRY